MSRYFGITLCFILIAIIAIVLIGRAAQHEAKSQRTNMPQLWSSSDPR